MSVGKIAWSDLTIENASEIRDFYSVVVGWDSVEVEMTGYSDYVMQPLGANPDGSEGVAGICHRRGSNSNIPSVWLVYITVADLTSSLEKVIEMGGEILEPPQSDRPFAIIRDPSGAVCALYQS